MDSDENLPAGINELNRPEVIENLNNIRLLLKEERDLNNIMRYCHIQNLLLKRLVYLDEIRVKEIRQHLARKSNR